MLTQIYGLTTVADAEAVDSETRTSGHDDRRRKGLDRVEAFLSAARSAALP